jgi:hypothetical protein
VASRKGSGPSDYEIGYGRPPKPTQFAPGKSGNPKGRPKGTRTVGAILQDILGRKITVTENGKTRRISTLEVMLLRLASDAMRAEQSAIKLLLSLADRYAGSQETALQLGELSAEDRAILDEYLPKPVGQGLDQGAKEDDKESGDAL